MDPFQPNLETRNNYNICLKILILSKNFFFYIILNLFNRDLSMNEINGTIPTELGNLTQLQEL